MSEDFSAIPPAALAARHRLLREIGGPGVARLASSTASLEGLSTPAAHVARAYLERASVKLHGDGAGEEDAAHAHLSGALFALEHVTQAVGIERPPIPVDILRAVLTP